MGDEIACGRRASPVPPSPCAGGAAEAKTRYFGTSVPIPSDVKHHFRLIYLDTIALALRSVEA